MITRSRLALIAGTACGIATVPLAHTTALATPAYGLHFYRSALMWIGLAVAACMLLRFAPQRTAVGVLIGLAVAVRIAAVVPTAPLSDDLYRYAWDGRVQAQGIDPYRYAPADAALIGLRDPWLWPGHCSTIVTIGCTRINRPTGHTIYPPVAQAWFLTLHITGVTRAHDRGLESAGLAVDLASLAVLLALLRRRGRDVRLATWWALLPMPILELTSDAHVDGLGIALTLAALWVAERRRDGAAGVVLGLAALTKLYPALLLPALLARRGVRKTRLVAAFAGTVVLGYLPHVLAVGTHVLGYLPTYLKEENYESGTRYGLISDLGIHGQAGSVAAIGLLLATLLFVLLRRPDPEVGATWTYGVLFLITTPAYPWYSMSLLAVAILARRLEWAGVALAAYPLYVHGFPVNGADRHGYAIAALVVAVVSGLRFLRSRRSLAAPTIPAPAPADRVPELVP